MSLSSRSEAARRRWANASLEDRRRNTAAARREYAVREIVAAWPELRPDQVARLRALLQPPGGGQDAA